MYQLYPVDIYKTRAVIGFGALASVIDGHASDEKKI